MVVRWIERIQKRYSQHGIPYGIRWNGKTFTVSGKLSKKSSGLTCATFILAVFGSAGISLVDRNTWRPRPDDTAWQEQIIELLIRHSAEPTHIEILKNDLGCVRFRPEEVVAACCAPSLPAPFEFCERNGTAVKQMQVVSRVFRYFLLSVWSKGLEMGSLMGVVTRSDVPPVNQLPFSPRKKNLD